MPKKILVIDDEPMIVESVSYNLKQEGYDVMTATDGETGLKLAETGNFDLILLDLMLPGMDGMEVCRTIRKTSEIPIIMLTAKEGEIDRVLGLELGADDYVIKPFSMRELMARVKRVLKRTAIGTEADGAKATGRGGAIVSGRLQIDLLGHEVTVNGETVNLSSKEFELLKILASHPGQVLTREQLLDLVWGNDFYGDSRTVDVHIRWLREKIEADPGNPEFILTVRGVGYKFRK